MCSHGYKAALKHFIGFFEIDNNLYLVDDIGKKCDFLPKINLSSKEREIYSLPITSSLYYLIQKPVEISRAQAWKLFSVSFIYNKEINYSI